MKIIMLFLFFISLLGYSYFFKKELKIDVAFAVPTSICLISTVFYIAALAGGLKYCSIPVFVLGLLLFVVYISIDRKKSLDFFYSPPVLLLISGIVIISIFTYGNIVSEYDNFTHWLLNVRVIFEGDKLPSSGSLVMFYTYPPISSLLGYYAAKIIGFEEDILVIVQNIAVLSMLLSMLYKATWKKVLRVALGAISAFACLCVIWCNISELYVDTLLGAATVFVIFTICSEKKNLLQYIPQFLAVGFLTLIKTTGCLFVFLMVLYWVISHSKKNLKSWLFTALTAVYGFFVWLSFDIYVGKYFDKSDANLPFSYGVFLEHRENGLEFRNNIKSYLLKLFDFKEKYLLAFFVCCAISIVFVVLMYINKNEKRKTFLRREIGRIVFVVVWTVGLFCMYIALFKPEELASYSAFERYYGTAIIVYIGLLALNICDVEYILADKKSIAAAVCCLWFIFPLVLFYNNYFKPPQWQTDFHNDKIKARELLIKAKNEYGEKIPENAAVYVVLDGLIEESLVWPYSRYEFMSDEFKTLDYWAREEQKWNKDGQYVLYLSSSDTNKEYLKEYNGGKDPEYGLYLVQNGKLIVQ